MFEKLRNAVPIVLVVIIMVALLAVPGLIESRAMYRFAEPLHDHVLVDEDIILHKGVQYQPDGRNKIAVVLLRSEMNLEETRAFYSDILDGKEDSDLIVAAEAVRDDDTVYDVIKSKGYYDADLNYYWVYLYTDDYAAQVFRHDLPEGDRILKQDIYYPEETTQKVVYIHLETDMTVEETETLFSDVLNSKLAKKDEFVLEVKPLDEEALEAVREQGEFREHRNYYVVSVSSVA